jgi:hypothetical protein
MSKSNTFENDFVKLAFQNADIANIGDAGGLRGSVAAGSLYWSLHSAWPGEAGDQTTSEIAYTGYARVAGARSAGGFTVTGNAVNPAANVDFPQCTGGSAAARFFGIGASSSGVGKLMYAGVVGGPAKNFVGTADDNVRVPAHGLVVNDEVALFPTDAGSLPAGVVEGTVYFVKTAPDADNITISATQGGATLDITAAGSGVLHKVTAITITSTPVGVVPRLTTNTTIKED